MSNKSNWQLFTSHGLVLISLLNSPGKTIREMGLELGLTDRSVSLAINDLLEEGYIVKTKLGRRCFYGVNENQVLKYPKGLTASDEGIPQLTVKALRAENLATHAEHLDNPEQAPIKQRQQARQTIC